MSPNGDTITNGAFGALNQLTGVIAWETQVPDLQVATLAPTIVGDIMMSGSTGAEVGYVPGSLIALNKNTGDILLNVQLDAQFHGGIAFANQYMLVGTGYSYNVVSCSSLLFIGVFANFNSVSDFAD
jgi:outer membrane protein assembly factor BamB